LDIEPSGARLMPLRIMVSGTTCVSTGQNESMMQQEAMRSWPNLRSGGGGSTARIYKQPCPQKGIG
jgi:hypothetical protein